MEFETLKAAAVDPKLSLVVLFFLIVFLLQLIFYGLIFPMLVLIDLKKSEALSKSKKVFWLISILLTWTFGAVSYGLFVSEKKSLKMMSNIFLITAIVQICLLGYLFLHSG